MSHELITNNRILHCTQRVATLETSHGPLNNVGMVSVLHGPSPVGCGALVGRHTGSASYLSN